MGAPLPRPAALNARLETPIEEWPYLDEAVLLKTRSPWVQGIDHEEAIGWLTFQCRLIRATPRS